MNPNQPNQDWPPFYQYSGYGQPGPEYSVPPSPQGGHFGPVHSSHWGAQPRPNSQQQLEPLPPAPQNNAPTYGRHNRGQLEGNKGHKVMYSGHIQSQASYGQIAENGHPFYERHGEGPEILGQGPGQYREQSEALGVPFEAQWNSQSSWPQDEVPGMSKQRRSHKKRDAKGQAVTQETRDHKKPVISHNRKRSMDFREKKRLEWKRKEESRDSNLVQQNSSDMVDADHKEEKCSLCPLDQVFVEGKLREHLVMNHLPWYILPRHYLKVNNESKKICQAEQLAQILVKGTKRSDPNWPFMNAWANLANGLLLHIVELMNLQNCRALITFVLENHLYPENEERIKLEDRKLLDAHSKMFCNGREVKISPPNCGSALLYWKTLVLIIKEGLSEEQQQSIHYYEKFQAEELLPRKPFIGNTDCIRDDIKNLFWKQLKLDRNCGQIQNYLTDHPELVFLRYTSGHECGTIHFAINGGQIQVASLLLMNGAPVDMEDNKGHTALYRAVEKGQTRAVYMLLLWGAQKELEAAIDLAAEHENHDILRVLTSAHSNPELYRRKEPEPDVRPPQPYVCKQERTDSTANATACPVCCDSQQYDEKQYKIHLANMHLPWYILPRSLRHQNKMMKKNLAGQLAGKFLAYVSDNKPDWPFMRVWANVANGLLLCLVEIMDFPNCKALLSYVQDNHLYPASDEKITQDDKKLMEAHSHMFCNGKEVQVSPPNCLSALLYWEILMLILKSGLSELQKQRIQSCEKFQVYEFHGRMPVTGDTANIKDTQKELFWKQLADGKDYAEIQKSLNDAPDLVFLRLRVNKGHNEVGTVQMALTKGNVLLAHLLLINWAPVDMEDSFGHTALYTSVKFGNEKAVRMLLQWGAHKELDAATILAAQCKSLPILGLLTATYTNPDLYCRKRPAQDMLPHKQSPPVKQRKLSATCSASPGKAEQEKGRSNKGGIVPKVTQQVICKQNIAKNGAKMHFTNNAEALSKICCLCFQKTELDFEKKQSEENIQLPETSIQSTSQSRPDRYDPKSAQAEKETLGASSQNHPEWKEKVHLVKNHLPWYIFPRQFLACISDIKKTRLSEQLATEFRLCAKYNKDPDWPFMGAWAKLSNGLLLHLAELMDLPNCNALLRWVRKHNLFYRHKGMVRREDWKIMQAHSHMFCNGKRVNVSPPNCVSALLYWKTLVLIFKSRLSEQQRQGIHMYERFQAEELLPRRPVTGDSVSIPEHLRQMFWKRLCIGMDCVQVQNIVTKDPDLVFLRYIEIEDLHECGTVQFAITNDHLQIARLLLMNGAPVDMEDNTGHTALFTAVKKDNIDAVNILLLWGAQKEMDFCIELASLNGSKAIMDLLMSADCKHGLYDRQKPAAKKVKSNSCIRTTNIESSEQTRCSQDSSVELLQSKEVSEHPSLTRPCIQQHSICPICNCLADQLKIHILTQHLPWYVCINTINFPQEDSRRRTKLCEQLYPSLQYSNQIMEMPEVCLTLLWGELLCGLLEYLTEHLNMKDISELYEFVCTRKLFTSAAVEDMSEEYMEEDLLAIKAYQAYIGDSPKHITVFAPPKHFHFSAMVHWRTLAMIIANLPEASRGDVLTLERYHCQKSVPVPRKRAKKQLVLPNDISTQTVTTFCALIEDEQPKLLYDMLLECPSLVRIKTPIMHGCCPVFYALHHENYHAACLLMLEGAELSQVDEMGWSPLHTAASEGNTEAIKFLLLWGAPLDQKDPDGHTAVDIARMQEMDNITALLEKAETEN